MKKNIAMRVAAILFILTMISTCAFSTTFAKYVTSGSATDTARVAKWGVELTVKEGTDDSTGTNFFVKAYDGTVESSTDDLVAPGTGNSTGITFTLSGTPEVDAKIEFQMTVNSDVHLPAGNGYKDWTTANTTDTFDLAADYYPVVFTLKQDGVTKVTGNLAAVEAYLEGAEASKTIEANHPVDVEYVLTWAWAYEVNNQADTLLGQIVAGKDSVANSSVNVGFNITCTVTQVE